MRKMGNVRAWVRIRNKEYALCFYSTNEGKKQSNRHRLGQELEFNNVHVSLRCLYFLIESVWYF